MPDRRAEARRRLRRLYEEVRRDLASRPGLVCGLSGRCCRFREADHRLFLTRLEYEEMADRGGARGARPDGACPWLEGGLCANREGRALACRTYFCSDEGEAAEVTERWHGEIRRLHADLALEYEYADLEAYLDPPVPRPGGPSTETGNR